MLSTQVQHLRRLPPPVGRLAKRALVYPRYWRQVARCKQAYRDYGERYPKPILFVAGLPKSGSTWLERMLASYPGWNELLIPEVARFEMRSGGSHHYPLPADTFTRFAQMLVLTKMHVPGTPHNVALLRASAVPYVVLFRDLRDVAVSHYHYVRNTPWHPEYRAYAALDLDGGLHHFARTLLPAYVDWIRTWRANRDPELSLEVRYESMLEDPHAHLSAILDLFGLPADAQRVAEIVEAQSFKRLSGGRERGEANTKSFFRSGKAGGWREVFTPAHTAAFQEHAGALFEKLGYPP